MRLFYLLSFLILSSVSHAQSPYQSLLLNENLTKNANAVVRLDRMDIQISSPKEMTYRVDQVVTVLNKYGNKHARTSVSYDGETKIKSIEAFVYDKLGQEIDHIKKKDFQDVSVSDGFSLYVDDRVLTYSYTPTQYPYTLEFSYEVETSDTAFFPPWYFLSDYMVSVEKSHYAISYASPELKPEIQKFNLDKISVSETDIPGRILFKATKIPAFKSESLSPSFRNIVPRLSVRMKNFSLKGKDAHVSNWKDFGRWMDTELLKDKATLTPEAIAKAKDLVNGMTDNLEKAKTIYKYVQENTRYISVQIGIGGWSPISAIEVDKLKYGDCKGLSNYTHALLKAVGVPSYYTVIHAGRQKVDFDVDFAAMQGNHAILAIPYDDKYYWIDCTSQTHPFGFIGDFTDDRKALVVTPDGGAIVRTVAYLNEQNYQYIKADIALSREGTILGKVDLKTGGIHYDKRFGLETKVHDDILKHYKNHWANIGNLNIEKYEFENDKENVVFSETVDLEATNYASLSGDRILFTVNAFNDNGSVPDRYRNRKLPFEIQRGFFNNDELTIKLPVGYEIEALPNEKNIVTDFGEYKISFLHDSEAHNVLYKRSLLVKKGSYPKERYKDYRNFRKEVDHSDGAQIVLLRKDPTNK